jgi:hypothetical protein
MTNRNGRRSNLIAITAHNSFYESGNTRFIFFGALSASEVNGKVGRRVGVRRFEPCTGPFGEYNFNERRGICSGFRQDRIYDEQVFR